MVAVGGLIIRVAGLGLNIRQKVPNTKVARNVQ
jgi:hypothetical protein